MKHCCMTSNFFLGWAQTSPPNKQMLICSVKLALLLQSAIPNPKPWDKSRIWTILLGAQENTDQNLYELGALLSSGGKQ